MKVFVVEDQKDAKKEILDALSPMKDISIHLSESLQEAIELLEIKNGEFDLIICDYHGTSAALIKCLITQTKETPCIILRSSDEKLHELANVENALVEVIDRKKIAENLSKSLDRFSKRGLFLQDSKNPDSDFVRINTQVLISASPLKSDIYLRLSANKYSKLYNQNDNLTSSNLENLRQKGIEYLYVRKEQTSQILEFQTNRLDKLAQSEDQDPNQVKEVLSSTLDVIQDLTAKSGFDEKSQRLAKSSVILTLKMIGNKPRLAGILTRLRADEGKYITSHSLMLAEVTCALAFTIGWKSPATFFKLALASFLHDLPLRDNQLAREKNLDSMRSRFKPEQIQEVRFHTVKAAEYAKQFHEIPADVDTIIAQHHEQPDGSGFPRGLTHSRIAPLACLFIVGHDFLDYFLDHGNGAKLSEFVRVNTEKYGQGTFKKIFRALETGEVLKS